MGLGENAEILKIMYKITFSCANKVCIKQMDFKTSDSSPIYLVIYMQIFQNPQNFEI
jgi:hypothetical protein